MVSKSNETLSWHDARQECASLAGNYDLAIVNTSEIFEFLKEYDSHWIGLIHREGNVDGFQWVDGKGLDFGEVEGKRPWSDTEPNVSNRSFIYSHIYLYYFNKSVILNYLCCNILFYLGFFISTKLRS